MQYVINSPTSGSGPTSPLRGGNEERVLKTIERVLRDGGASGDVVAGIRRGLEVGWGFGQGGFEGGGHGEGGPGVDAERKVAVKPARGKGTKRDADPRSRVGKVVSDDEEQRSSVLVGVGSDRDV